MSMVGLWDELHPQMAGPLGVEATYEAAAKWLDGYGLVEDRGCGLAYARRFFKRSAYRGVDGSGDSAEVKADLATYRNAVPCILLRHVVEHNVEWRRVLANAVADFERRMALVVFTPLGHETSIYRWDGLIPYLTLSERELLAYLQPWLRHTFQYPAPGGEFEHLFLLEKP